MTHQRHLRGVRQLEGVGAITRHADVREAARDWRRFSSDLQGDPDWRTYRQLPLEVDPPLHTEYRALLSPVFERTAIAALEPAIRHHARALVARAARQGSAEAVADLAIPLVAASIGMALGRVDDIARFRDWGVYAIDIGPDGRRDGGRLDAYLDRVIEAARRRPGSDLFGRLATTTVDGRRLTSLEQRGIGNLVLAAGRDTVIGLVCGLVWHLGRDGEMLRRLKREPDRIPAAVEELLRFVSPLASMERLATANVSGSWGGAAPGDIVILGFLDANHDPDRFASPWEINLERRPNPHVAFGAGPHTCLGVHLARLEARVLLEEFLDAAPGWQLAPGARIEFETVGPAAVPTRFDQLPIVLAP